MLDVSEKKEIREIIKDEMNKLLINPLMILAQGIADIKDTKEIVETRPMTDKEQLRLE